MPGSRVSTRWRFRPRGIGIQGTQHGVRTTFASIVVHGQSPGFETSEVSSLRDVAAFKAQPDYKLVHD